MVPDPPCTRSAALLAVCSRALGRGVPSVVVSQAADAVRARLGREEHLWGERRIEAYFWGVVRRMAMRGGASTRCLRERFVSASDPSSGDSEQLRLAV